MSSAIEGPARGSTSASVEQLGRLIVTSRPGYRPGHVISLEMVSAEVGVQRAIAREVLQILHQKRLVRLRPRVGATVLPVEQWDVFDPDVIKWRLKVTPRSQMRSLTEVRQAIEPIAASLAAERASADVQRDLVILSQQLQQYGLDDRFKELSEAGKTWRSGYLALDAEFHRTLLKGSQNEMFYAMADPVNEALEYRIKQDWAGAPGPGAEPGPGIGEVKPFPREPSKLALWLHRGLAAAIEQGHPTAAEAFSRAILFEVRNSQLPRLVATALHATLPLLGEEALGSETEAFRDAITEALDQAMEGHS